MIWHITVPLSDVCCMAKSPWKMFSSGLGVMIEGAGKFGEKTGISRGGTRRV